MKASEIITQLIRLQEKYGDLECRYEDREDPTETKWIAYVNTNDEEIFLIY